MKGYIKADRNHFMQAGLVLTGISVNIIFSFIMNRLGLPLFLDTIGTIGVAMLGGYFYGIFTAVSTNFLCAIYNSNAVYFSCINATVAIFTVYYFRKKTGKKIKDIIYYILIVGSFSGFLSAVIKLGILDKSHYSIVEDAANAFVVNAHFSLFFAAVLVNILLSIFEKGIAIGVVLLIERYIPEKYLEIFGKGKWKQKPLSSEDIKNMREQNKSIRHSVRVREAVTLIATSGILVVAMAWIALNFYFDDSKEEKKQNAYSAAKFAAEVVDPAMIDTYLKLGKAAEGYLETEKMLNKIKESSSGVKYLYLVKIREDGCYFIFDAESEDTEAYELGTKVEFDKEFLPYLPKLYAGEEIEPIESSGIGGWLLTVYYPLKDEAGNCVCYVGCDVSIDNMAQYMIKFLFKVMLVIAGLFIFIISYALWKTNLYITYPIGSMTACVDQFASVEDDQKKLDENVKKIRSLDIHTNDEIEKMYQAICQMTLNQAEQMRSIRYLSESTAKMQDGLIITMADMVESRDSDTGAHVQKTAAYVKIIAEGLKKKGYYLEKVTPKFISDCVRSAPLHDVGKINISDEILNKPGKLTDEEYEIMKTHTTAGKMIIEKAISTVQGGSYLKEARNMATYHHERWDGKGYPEKLHGEVIPLSARIMAVADVFDALTSPRVYKPAFPLEKALAILEEGSGTQFDPKCVEVFMDSLVEVKAILKKYHGNE